MKHAFIEANKRAHSIRRLCGAFGLSRSAHYGYQRRAALRTTRDAPVLEAMKAVHGHRYTRSYGSPRMTAELRAKGFCVNHKKVARLMRVHGIRAAAVRRKTKTTDSRHRLAVAANHLARDFRVGQGPARWVSDITYLRIWGGFVYLAVILDVGSRRWLGYALGAHLRASLCEQALEMATVHEPNAPELFHADRGSQYASESFRAALAQLNAELSMSRKGNCWDNAVAESFFASFKREAADSFVDLNDAQREVFDYFLFYNRERKHSTLGYQSPEAYHAALSQQSLNVA